MTVTIGIKGHCAHCDITFELKPWQLNAIAIEEPFDCPYCQRILQLSCPRQLRQSRRWTTGPWCTRAWQC